MTNFTFYSQCRLLSSSALLLVILLIFKRHDFAMLLEAFSLNRVDYRIRQWLVKGVHQLIVTSLVPYRWEIRGWGQCSLIIDILISYLFATFLLIRFNWYQRRWAVLSGWYRPMQSLQTFKLRSITRFLYPQWKVLFSAILIREHWCHCVRFSLFKDASRLMFLSRVRTELFFSWLMSAL